MTVAEVIEALKIAPPDAYVHIHQTYDDTYKPFDVVIVSFINGQSDIVKIGGYR